MSAASTTGRRLPKAASILFAQARQQPQPGSRHITNESAARSRAGKSGADAAAPSIVRASLRSIISMTGLLHALGARHHIGGAKRGEDAHQMLDVVHFDVEMEGVEAAVAARLLHADDVGSVASQYTGDDGERAGLVLDDDAQPRRAAVRFVAPGEVDPVGVDAVGKAVAADHMDLDLGPFAPEADDSVAGDRVAALRQIVGYAWGQALDRDGGLLGRRLDASLAGRAGHQGFHH